MTSLEDIAASYAAEKSYQWDVGDVIDSSDAVGAWGVKKNGTTKILDESGNNHDGTIHGCMPSSGYFLGRRFDGLDDYVDCGNDASLDFGTGDYTIGVWIKVSTSVRRTILSKLDPAVPGPERGFVFDVLTDGKIRIVTETSSVEYMLVDSTVAIDDNNWHYVVGIRDGVTMKVYIDGMDKSDTQTTLGTITTINSFINLTSGYPSFSGSTFFNGTIDDVRIYNRALSQTEIQTQFNTLAKLPFWSISYTDYPDNVATYTERLPYSTTVISSGTFKKDAGVLDCVSAGTITYRASYEFDGSEFITVNKGLATEFSGTGSATSDNTTVSVAQGSNKITCVMGTGDTIRKIGIQFRAEV